MAEIPLFSQLLPFTWRGINFPVSHMAVQLKQDTALHKAWGRDGAVIEPTGRDVLVFSASIPFRNGVWSGQAESYGVLYPSVWRLFLAAMADKSLGILQHPELGEIECVPLRADVSWDANKRDGCDVQAEWLESTENQERLSSLDTISPVTDAQVAMDYADGTMKLDSAQLPQRPEFQPTFADQLRQIQAIGDRAALKSAQLAGRIDALRWRLGEVQRAYARGGDPRQAATVQRLLHAQRAVDRLLENERREVAYWRVPQDCTWAGAAQQLKRPMAKLMALNPRLLHLPVLPRDTAVQYER